MEPMAERFPMMATTPRTKTSLNEWVPSIRIWSSLRWARRNKISGLPTTLLASMAVSRWALAEFSTRRPDTYRGLLVGCKLSV